MKAHKLKDNTTYSALVDHTHKAYVGLSEAYTYFNEHLFDNKLPTCLITYQRHKGAYGYFWRDKFSYTETKDATKRIQVDEIALNPSTFNSRTPGEVLSTLAHEMVHLWQFHFGEPSRNGYHNKSWGTEMKRIGLHPSSTGKEGGKETGQRVSHYIIVFGLFDKACADFLRQYELSLYADNPRDVKTAKKKSDSKTKFTCEMCGQNAWAKPDACLKCGVCDDEMLAEG